jgi:segregation and condensation protein A
MMEQKQYSITLDNFEGPLEFLLFLVQKSEIDIYDVRLQQITDQFIKEMSNPDLDFGAEFVGTLASLLWLKSKMLLPKHEQVDDDDTEGPDPHFEVIHQLIDYCRFKQAGRDLVVREHEQHSYYLRGMVSGDQEVKKPLGIEHLSMDDLALLFKDIVAKAKAETGMVQEESFRLSDTIRDVRRMLKSLGRIPFEELFHPQKCKAALIITFLAILELMKNGEVSVIRDHELESIVVVAKKAEHIVGEVDEQRDQSI